MKPERLEEIRQHAKYRTLVTFNTQAIDELLAEIDRLRALVPKWQKIGTGEHKENEVLIVDAGGNKRVAHPKSMQIHKWRAVCELGRITHWMPLPETKGEVK